MSEIIKPELYRDSFQNFKTYGIPKAQLILSDVPYCYDTETECFTRNGWKRFDEITMEDEVLSLNHKTMEMCYSGIENIIIRDNNEDLYLFQHSSMNLCITAKHRCYARMKYIPNLKYGKRLKERKRIHTEDIRTADTITKGCFIPRNGYIWNANIEVPSVITIPSCELKSPSRITPAVDVELDAWLRFFGLWLADGCTSRAGSTGYSVSIKQFGTNRDKVREIMSALPFKMSESVETKRNASNFNIYSKQLYSYLKPFGNSHTKYIPRWILDLPIDKLRIFWDAYTFGDSGKNGSGLHISSVSKKLIEGLQEVALKLGVICQCRLSKSPSLVSELHFFQFNPNSRNIVYPKPTIIHNYTGKVWCLTLKTNSVFLVRRNGMISFSGNCLGNNAFASNPKWYNGGDNKNGESELAGKAFFNSDYDFRPAEFMHFCSQMLKPERKDGVSEEDGENVEMVGSKRKSNAPCMIIFVPFEQMHYYIELGARYGLKKYIPLIFRKNFSAQVLKANMKVVGNCEYGLILYRNKLPKFNNEGRMVFNCFDWCVDNDSPKIHTTQKPIPLLERLISIFTDPGDVVIDPCAGSGSTLRAAANLGRRAYGFEIDRKFYKEAKEKMLNVIQPQLF